ncbi:MAG TPA: TetR/AcrR family transcriptional regulator [Ramlibacter sp.]|nr:TetR/AcrR family transcriptional regulator [Ramlibacter sp.]
MAPRAYNNENRLQQQAELKARIAEAAAALHKTQGALATSYAQVAQQAGVSVPTVYKHFPTLDTLIQACTAHVASQAPAFPAEAILQAPELSSAVDALVAATDAMHAHFQPWLVWREQQRIPALAAMLAQEREQMLKLCESLLARHLGAGDHRSTASWWEALLAFDLRQRVLGEHRQSRPAYRRTLASLLLAVTGPQRASETTPRPKRKP